VGRRGERERETEGTIKFIENIFIGFLIVADGRTNRHMAKL
jgi:hypothetical protein